MTITFRLQNAVTTVSRLKKESVSEKRHADAAEPTEHKAQTHEAGALVIIGGQLRNQCRVRHFKKGQKNSNGNRHKNQKAEHGHLGLQGKFGRIPHQCIGDANWNDREIHKRMTPTPFGAPIIRNIADKWIRDGIDNNCHCKRETSQHWREA